VSGWPFRLACVLCFSVASSLPVGGQDLTGRISGTVVDSTGSVLAGVAVALGVVDETPAALHSQSTKVVASTVTDQVGRFEFDRLAAGTYTISAERSGYAPGVRTPILVSGAQAVDVQLRLTLARVSEVVTVVGSTGAGEPLEADEVQAELLRVFRLPTDRFLEALPLLPGVVRDRRGRLSFNGTRPSQSTLLVNGTNATDPVTGQFAFDLPLSVVETVEVHAIPYSAEFGQVSGAVASVRTAAGGDRWSMDVGSLFPDPRFRDGKLSGINTATPRVKVSGPLRPGSIWLSQAVSYRFGRSQVKEDIPGPDEEIVEGFDTFTQIDLKLGDRHAVTGTVSVFPTDVENGGIDSLHPALATPNTESRGWNVALVDELTSGSTTIWQTKFALRGYDVAVRPKGTGPSQLTPDGLYGNYFNEIDRRSRQLELGIARLQGRRSGAQEHLVKIGGQLMATSFDGTDRNGPIEIRGADGRLLQRITFQGTGELESSDVITSWYVQDYWQVSPRLALDVGARYDYDAMLGESHLSPRTAFSLTLDADGQTFVKGGWGVFFDQVFLQADAFDHFQQRVEQSFHGAEDAPAGPPVVFENRRGSGELEQPTSHVWNVELDHELGESLTLRVNYRQNRARDRLVINRVTDDAGSALVLSATGTLIGREFDATVRWTPATHSYVFVSFSKIRTAGDLNDFGLVYDNLREPLIFENAEAPQAFEVPNRVLMWGVITLPQGFTVTPGIEWRDGFPYTIFAEDYTVIGEQNRAQFPRFFSADVAVTKHVTLFGRQIDVGVQAYNLTSHHNPRDVVSNVASQRFGEFRNSVGSTFSLKLGLGI
jgi:hypothetical protein